MMRMVSRHVLFVFSIVVFPARLSVAEELQFRVTLAQDAVDLGREPGPFTGRLYLMCTQHARGEPRFGPNWFGPEPFFGVDVRDVRPGDSMLVDGAADGFPGPLSELQPGKYRVQAMLDHCFDSHSAAAGAGNFYSEVQEVEVGEGSPARVVELSLTKAVEPATSLAANWLREVSIDSPLLTAFHRRPVQQQATVVLPASYEGQPARRFPVIYGISGFGGNHRHIGGYARMAPPAVPGEEEFIRVFLNADCKWGHHVFADSATNGPRGQALVEELIPHLDANFRTVAAATARYVTGHSSGGWSSLWLQVAYPDVFGGVWSTSPDPVDFRDYQQVNLYADVPQSLYVDEQGARRPIARRGETPVLWYDDFGKMDDVIGRGGQLRSFEAVFSPLGADGLPRKLWDRRTGRIDPEVAQAWQAYDIRLQIERNWPRLAPKLRGKLHITTGSLDTFYLEGAVRLLGDTLKQLGSDAEVVVVEGADHGSVLTRELVQKMLGQMSESFRKHRQGM